MDAGWKREEKEFTKTGERLATSRRREGRTKAQVSYLAARVRRETLERGLV
jgi:hypothetical protein